MNSVCKLPLYKLSKIRTAYVACDFRVHENINNEFGHLGLEKKVIQNQTWMEFLKEATMEPVTVC